MKIIKKIIKYFIEKPFNLMGYDVMFSKSRISSTVLVDKYVWEPYLKNDLSMNLYNEGLKRSGLEWTDRTDNYYKQLRYYSLHQMVLYVLHQNLTGDFAECGTWKGHSAYIISSILNENGFTGGFHIFDSFEGGLSEKVEEDQNIRVELNQKQIQEESNIFHSTEDEVKSCLNNFNFIHLYKGWIPNRFNEVETKQYSFVHLDVDLYEPTRDSLNFFFPKLLENGVIVCDDYGISQFPGAKKAVDEFLEKNNCNMFYEVPMGGCFIIK